MKCIDKKEKWYKSVSTITWADTFLLCCYAFVYGLGVAVILWL